MACVKEINYEEYKELIGTSKSFILELWAEWCHPCKIMMPYLEEACEKLNACYFFRINVDKNPKIIDELNINSIPRIILFVNGEKTGEIKGFQKSDVIIEEASKILCDSPE
ncbi:thioredoxin [Thermoplasma volcanium GSS1]|uniref:Thioredoxin n=1 Tax=Thermoplasma volcanium (strain ATCC 51530 / DSM 4299 / JCM 9571 / NBRC 15438 / GSS1) TaxID=273116 RepID=Q97AL9_THEVO|nr:thioredoxin family protein [Thermoplasma volcanium]BAB59933.1 thioredoxin [Thermoplasma volcanium GSS1]